MKGTKRKPSEDSFTAFVIDQLRALGGVEARAMFGGKGLYWKDQIFGLIDEGRLYFRASDLTSPRYQAQGSKPFEPWPGHVMKGYYEVPASILEDSDEAVAWAREAWQLPRAKPRTRAARRKK
jgi:DNA transformation protein